jgi:hypothetical protein
MRAARRNLAMRAARGAALVFCAHGQGWRGDAPGAVAAEAAGAVVITWEIAEALRRIAPDRVAGMAGQAMPAWPGLALAAPRAMFQAESGFDPALDDGTGLDVLDWVLRAARQGAVILALRSPWPAERQAGGLRFGHTEAARLFAARWMTGSSMIARP